MRWWVPTRQLVPTKAVTPASSLLEEKCLHRSCCVIFIKRQCKVNFICKLLVSFRFQRGWCWAGCWPGSNMELPLWAPLFVVSHWGCWWPRSPKSGCWASIAVGIRASQVLYPKNKSIPWSLLSCLYGYIVDASIPGVVWSLVQTVVLCIKLPFVFLSWWSCVWARSSKARSCLLQDLANILWKRANPAQRDESVEHTATFWIASLCIFLCISLVWSFQGLPVWDPRGLVSALHPAFLVRK